MRTVLKIFIALQNRMAFRLVAIVLFSLAGWWLVDSAAAAVYECKGDNGSIVLTDRPKGLRGCVLIETLAPSPSSKSVHASESQVLPQLQDDQALSAIPIPQIPQLPPRPASIESPASSQHEPRPCPSGINPLNPLDRGHCSSAAPQSTGSPDASQSPDTTQNP